MRSGRFPAVENPVRSPGNTKVLVTGGSRGLGAEICRALLDEGRRVIACARAESPEVRRLARVYGERFEFVACDLAKPGHTKRLAKAARVLDGIDAFVANAGVAVDGLLTLSAEEKIRACLEVNLVSTMLLARECIKGMLKSGGSLVFVSSVAARTGLAGLSVYGATKAGLIGFSRSLAREYGARGIRSNCVLPGFLETEMSATLSEERRQSVTRRTALGRLGQGQDVVGAICFLLSDEARYITGTELVVDGGMTA
jgi:3-oxoacyl-[acyl-carrier protein] reductase